MPRAGAALIAALALAGCMPAAPLPSEAPPARGFSLDGGGVQPAGTPLRIDFGRAQAGVIDAVTRLAGVPPEAVIVQPECGAGPVTAAEWANGVTLNFLDGDFLGWTVSEPGVPVAGGLAVGQPRAALTAAQVQDTTLGLEFRQGDIFGILDEGGTEVRMLWSGLTCFFR